MPFLPLQNHATRRFSVIDFVFIWTNEYLSSAGDETRLCVRALPSK